MSNLSVGILIISIIALPVLPFAYFCVLSWCNPHLLHRLIGGYTDLALKSHPEKRLSKNWLWAARIVLSIMVAVYLTIVIYLLVLII